MSKEEVTVQGLEDLAEQMAILRAEIDTDKEALSEKNGLLEEIEQKFLAHLKDLGKSSYKSNFGTISRTEKWRVNLPDSDEAKQQLIGYLREKGLESMLTVNSNTLNSYFNREWDAVKENGDPEEAMNFTLPGLKEAKMYESISFRKR